MIYVISHSKGGVAKSTTMWHLICEIHKEKQDYIAIDIDHQRTIFNINEYLRDKDDILNICTANSRSELKKIIKDNQEKLILIDTGGNGDDLNKAALKIADHIIVPIGADSITEAIGFKKFEAILHEIGRPTVNILFANIHHAVTNFDDISSVIDSYPNKKLKTVIRSRSNYKKSMGQGKGITQIKPSKNFEHNKQLARSIVEIKSLLSELDLLKDGSHEKI